MPFLWPSAFVKADLSLFPVAGQRGCVIWFGCIDFLWAAGMVLDVERGIRTEASHSQISPSGAQLLSKMGLAVHSAWQSFSSQATPVADETSLPGPEIYKAQTMSCKCTGTRMLLPASSLLNLAVHALNPNPTSPFDLAAFLSLP